MNTSYPQSVEELVEHIDKQRRVLLELVDSLAPEQRDDVRDPAGWSTKDHMAHLIAWERSMVFLLTGRPRWQGLGVSSTTYLSDDLEQINNDIYEQSKGADWDAVRGEFEEVHQEMIETLHAIGWQGLHRSYGHFAPDEPGEDDGTPVLAYVAGNTFGHYDQHRQWIARLIGQ